MRSHRYLLLPLALAAATPAQAVQLCAWLDESVEPIEDDDAPSLDASVDADVPADAAAAAEAAADAAEAAAEAAAAAADAAAEPAPADEPASGGTHNLKLWLQADADADFYYKMAGKGLVQDDGGYGHSPNSGTYVLHRGEPDSPWGFGMTFYPPGRIDVVIEIRAYPEDIFDEKDPPLLTSFTFARTVPEGETAPPPTLATHQCKDITFPPRKQP